uniref:Uncharacterized protein n=1 Tax=Podarcis muralis TaxID=64176 RepID=A0A670J490_PODMU
GKDGGYQHEFGQTAGGSGRQECLACSGPWGHEDDVATAEERESLLEVVMNQNVSLAGFRVPEDALAYSSCHLIFKDNKYRLTDMSHLGCHVHITKWLHGSPVQVPKEVDDSRRKLEMEKQS